MYQLKKYKILTYSGLAGMILFSFLLIILLWNAFAENHLKHAGLCILLSILVLICGSLIFYSALQMGDRKKIDGLIETSINRERKRMAEESKKARKAEENAQEMLNLQEMANSLIPDMRGIKNLDTLSEKVLSNLAKQFEMVAGIVYTAEKKSFHVTAKYALTDDIQTEAFKPGDTLPGQAVKNKELLFFDEIPENYFSAVSGTGKSLPRHLIFLPVLHKDEPVALIEMATFKSPGDNQVALLDHLKKSELGDIFAKFLKK